MDGKLLAENAGRSCIDPARFCKGVVMSDLKRTGLYQLHVDLGAKLVPFAGYEMPVQFPMGVMKEHLHTRESAGLFDVSHMGQVILRPKSGQVADAALAIETLVPVSIAGLAEGRQRYAMFTNDAGGILDDLMIANRGDHLFVVVNAACKDADIAHMRASIADRCDIEVLEDRSLLALQGPAAEKVMEAHAAGSAAMRFMDVGTFASDFGDLWISRSGYTGEDGYEISVKSEHALSLAQALLAHEEVEPIGLGARDSLRLEAGLCLYGSDLDETTSPVEADLGWAIQKARRSGGEREGGFPGAQRILGELQDGPARKRVGLLPDGRAPMRAGTPIFSSEDATAPIGEITSGAYGPTIERPMSMGYVETGASETGTQLWAEVRGKRLPLTVAAMPFRPSTYKR